MAKKPTQLERLADAAVLERHLAALLRRAPSLRKVAKAAGPFEVRLSQAGFPGLARVVVGQQLSIASARVIWMRLAALPGVLTPAGFLKLKETDLCRAGLSAGKVRTIRTIAEAAAAGALDFDLVETMAAEEAVQYLTVHKGIGPWTAEIYLMFCIGHPDIFPVGDLALRKAVGHAFGMDDLPDAATLAELASGWAPHRHTAALMFWRYYAAVLGKATGTALD